MGKTELTINPAKLPRGRRLLYFIYGDLIFDENFVFALKYADAHDLAKGVNLQNNWNWRGGKLPEGGAPLDALQDQLNHLTVKIGPEMISTFGTLLKEIKESRIQARFQEFVDCWIAHYNFCIKFNRPPRRDELRKNLWMSLAVPEAKKKQLTPDELRKHLSKVWKSKSESLGAIMTRDTLKRRAKSIGLYLFDHKFFARCQKCYKRIERELGQKPTKDEFLDQVKKLKPRLLQPLKGGSFGDLFSFLAWPIKYHPLTPWNHIFDVQKTLGTQIAPDGAGSDALEFFRAIAALGLHPDSSKLVGWSRLACLS